MILRKRILQLIILVCFVLSGILFMPFTANAQQQQQQQQKTPEEVAAQETLMLEQELGLTSSQAFFVDSTLQYNYNGLKNDFERMKNGGMQDPQTYKTIRTIWIDKNLSSFKKILTEQQYIKYLKIIGRGKEYKKGKDGLYYLKSELKKKN